MPYKNTKNRMGVYKIINLQDNKVYIGSAINIYSRWSIHKSTLRNNKNKNKNLQFAWNKFGEENFIIEIIEIVENKEDLISREQYWINKYKSYDEQYGYNISPTAGTTLGVKCSEDKKNKISKANKGKKFWLGKHHTEESKEKISNAISGEKHPFYNKHLSEEHRNKIGKSNKGKIMSEEAREKIRQSKLNTFLNDEIKDKIVLSVNKSFLNNNNSSAKLTKEDVIKIKKILQENILTQKEIGKMFNVHEETIGKIKRNKSWKFVHI